MFGAKDIDGLRDIDWRLEFDRVGVPKEPTLWPRNGCLCKIGALSVRNSLES